jgi:hypothetical protein
MHKRVDIAIALALDPFIRREMQLFPMFFDIKTHIIGYESIKNKLK